MTFYRKRKFVSFQITVTSVSLRAEKSLLKIRASFPQMSKVLLVGLLFSSSMLA